MRLAKSSRTLLPLALSAVLATCALAQEHPNVQPNAVRDQLTKQAPGGSQPPSAPQTPAPAPAKPPAPAQRKGSGEGPGSCEAGCQGSGESAGSRQGRHESGRREFRQAARRKARRGKSSVVRRDPFDTLLTKARASNAPPENLPPGKAGLIVETLRIDGIVHSPNGMIAIVSNSQQRVYFLREGDKLYDGSVEKIALDAISFNEIGKDAFGKPLERVVTKRLYPSPGEQQ